MPSLVMKFGGASLADGASLERACEIVSAVAPRRPIVVVSAFAGVTELLSDVATRAVQGERTESRVRERHDEILSQLSLDSRVLDELWLELGAGVEEAVETGRYCARRHDRILSLGERVSASIVAHLLVERGVSATSVDGFELGLTVEGERGAPKPAQRSANAMRKALALANGVPVVTGFLARHVDGHWATLGRNGSDWTAALIAEAVHARELILWKTVDGVMTADPSLVADARVLHRLSWGEAEAFGRAGAEVLHPEAVEPARRAGVSIELRNAFEPNRAGTRIDSGEFRDGPVGVAYRNGSESIVALVGGSEDAGLLEQRAAECLARAGVHARFAPDCSDPSVRAFHIAKPEAARAVRALHDAWFGSRRRKNRNR